VKNRKLIFSLARERRHGVFRKKTRIKFSRHRSQKLRSSSANLAVCWTANETKTLKFARKKIFCRRFTRLTRDRPIASCVNSPLSRVKIFPFSPHPLFRFSPTFYSPSFLHTTGEKKSREKKEKSKTRKPSARQKTRKRLTDETVAEVDKVNIFVARTKKEHPCLLFVCIYV